MHAQWIIPSKPVENSVVVFLHDALGSIGQWKKFPEELCSRLNLRGLIIERRGHGKSKGIIEKRDKDYLEKEAGILSEVLSQLNVANPILIGFSDGASIALLYASQFRIRGGIAIAPHTFVEPQTVKGIKMALLGEKGTLEKLKKYHVGDVQNLWASWWQTWLAENFQDWSIVERLADIVDPFLLIQSREDPYGSLVQLDVIQSNSSGNVFRTIIEGKAHAPHLSNMSECLAAIERFIEHSIFLKNQSI